MDPNNNPTDPGQAPVDQPGVPGTPVTDPGMGNPMPGGDAPIPEAPVSDPGMGTPPPAPEPGAPMAPEPETPVTPVPGMGTPPPAPEPEAPVGGGMGEPTSTGWNPDVPSTPPATPGENTGGTV
jgi:hypothetical protein